MMKRIKKALRLAGLVCLIILALMGIGVGGAAPILPIKRERYVDATPKTELVESAGPGRTDHSLTRTPKQ